jgi:hypothetical protein
MFRPPLALAIVFMFLPPLGASAQDATTSAKSQTAKAPVGAKGRGKVQRRSGFRAEIAPAQRTCGAFMYFKNGKCNDARNK